MAVFNDCTSAGEASRRMLNLVATALTLQPVLLPPQAALKKYQMEHKSKGESLEKCQAELKKLRRKSQGSKHPSKYGDKEMQVSVCVSLQPRHLDGFSEVCRWLV